MSNLIDLSDLLVKAPVASKDEALDLLGDLLDPTQTSLFGDKPIKITKPRPKWRIDGFVVVQRICKCLTCGALHKEVNPLIMLSESLIDHEGRVLRSQKTSDPESLRLKDQLDWESMVVSEETIGIDPVTFCNHCLASGVSQELIMTAFDNQRKETLRKQTNDDIVKSAVSAKAAQERAEAAEKRLFDLIDQYEKSSSDFCREGIDLPSIDDDLPY
jgi:hypothetical protein